MKNKKNTDHEAVRLLSEFIRIDTQNPPGNEAAAVEFFARIFDKEKIEYKVYESTPERASIRAVLPGTGKKGPVMLLNHTDVVPADKTEWSFDPLSGDIKDGYILGRGALDMKGQGIMELLAFLAMKREGIELARDLIFLAVADEEMGGDHGVGYLLKHHASDFSADVVINEGGFGISDILPDKPVMMISSGEKGICWLKLTRAGVPGHGSAPHGQNALENLTKAVSRLLAQENPIMITSIIGEYFKNLAEGWEFLNPYVEDGKDETLVKILTDTGFIAMPQIAAMVKNTISLNVMHSGEKTNIIPSHAEAVLDTRLLPGQKVDQFIGYIRDLLADDEITIEPIQTSEASESPIDTELYAAITDAVKKYFPDAVVTPSLLIGTSDSRFFRERGIPSYGVFPALMPMEHVKMIHGIDEKISIENMVNGTEMLTHLVKQLCT
jgi:acetylornithine deacetylase/succinyl-diaminopimelate desuccinylase-like protein